MKKNVLLGLGIFALGLVNAQTINKEELQWNIGNQWRMNVDNVSAGNLDLTDGSGKNWDFSTYTGANGKDTVKVVSSSVGDFKVTSTISPKIIPEVDYKSSPSNYSAAAVSGISMTDPTSLNIGLPHTLNKNWTVTGGNIVVGNLTVVGSVISSGTIKLPYGTFNCLVVKEITTGTGLAASLNSTVYYWETVEHGRVASYNGSKLSVMQSTNFTTSTKKLSSSSFNVFPNPAYDVLNIAADVNGGAVKIFNALGNVVKQFNHPGGQVKMDVSGLTNGMYFVQITSDKGVLTKSIIIK